MWLIFGSLAILATILNLYLYKTGRNNQLAMLFALSFTILTLVDSYSMVASWVQSEDWAALLDVVPTMSTAYWVLTILSIVINSTPALLEWRNEK